MTAQKNPDQIFAVGQVVGFRGLQGEVKVRPHTNNPELLMDITDVQITLSSGSSINATVKSVYLDRRLLIFKFHQYTDRTAAEILEDAELYTDRAVLRHLEKDEWWVEDLIGLEAFTTDGARLGTICNIIDAGGQLLEISTDSLSKSGQNKTILVPFVKSLVPIVDLKARRLEIINIPGLLEEQ